MSLNNILLTLTLILAFFNTKAVDIIQFVKPEHNKYIGKHIFTLKDTSQNLSFDDIKSLDHQFEKSQQEIPNLGADEATKWIRFSIRNNSNTDKLIISLSNTTIGEVVFYSIVDNKIDSTHIIQGDQISERQYPHQFFIFELPLSQGKEATCYLKLNSSTPLLVPISVGIPNNFWLDLLKTDIFSALYTGLMLAMVLYNIFLYFSTKERHYWLYVNYIFWVLVAQLAILGVLHPIFSIESHWISSRILTFTGAMSGLGAILFVKSFLNTRAFAPKFDRLLNLFLASYLFAIALLLIGALVPAYRLVNIIAGGGSAIVLILAFRLSDKNNKSTSYFLYAWCIFLLSVVIYVLKDYSVLPYNFFTSRAVQIGSVIEAMLLSFALGDKINTYRKEKNEAQERELILSKQNEKLIREQNTILEEKVLERTQELREANTSLQQTLTHLKETQSQLVEAEKMASLGQLTAGVAHEINNPINFVTSNVNPLRRDITMIWDTLNAVEEIAVKEDMSKAERETKITAIKHQYDIAYIKTEVEFLLKGIQEGASRTAEIVKSLRIFSRVDEDAIKYADINEGLESTIIIINSLFNNIEVTKTYGDIPKIECYAGKLNQVFLNILTNAIYAIDKKFTNKTGGKLEIETGYLESDSTIFIKIMDNGIGISQEHKEKIFEPFFTTKEVGEGTGLGLSITYNTIAKHQGQIKLSSEVNVGTTFTLIIPVKQS